MMIFAGNLLHVCSLVVCEQRNVHFISGLIESGLEFVTVDIPDVKRLTIHLLRAASKCASKFLFVHQTRPAAALFYLVSDSQQRPTARHAVRVPPLGQLGFMERFR